MRCHYSEVSFIYKGSIVFVIIFMLGDFRLSLSELRNIDCLHNDGTPIDINTLYLDTTFCHNQANDIISRVLLIMLLITSSN